MGAGGSLVTLRDNVVTLIGTYNTTGGTYDISNSLTQRVVAIEAGVPEKGQPLTKLPCVLVHVDNYEDEWTYLGSGSKREITYTINVWAATNIVSTLDDAVEENFRLTDNLLSLFRAKYDLSMATFWVDKISTETVEMDYSVYQKITKIILRGHEIA